MHISPETADILFVTGEALDPQAARDRLGLTAGVATLGTENVCEQVAGTGASCLLLGADLDSERAIEIVRALAECDETPPVIVFADDATLQFTERLFTAGATDVIQSTPAETSPVLLRQRIEQVTPATTINESLADRYEILLETAADAIYQICPDGKIAEANRATVEMTGYSRSALIGMPVSELVDEDTLLESERLREAQLAGEADDVLTVEATLIRKTGETVPCEIRVRAIREDGDIAGWVGVARDIREKHEREVEIERTRELLSNAERLGDVGVWEVDLDTGEMFWSDGARRIRNIDADFEPTTEDVLEFYHPDHRRRVSDLVEQCHETGEPFSTRAQILTEDGVKRWVHLQGEPIERASSRDVRGYIQDITERIEREQELQAERDLVEQVLEISPVGIITTDPSGTIVQANEQATTILGLSETDLVDSHFTLNNIVVLDAEGDEVGVDGCPATQVLEDGKETRNREMIIERPDGSQRVISVDAVPLFEDGEIQRAIITFEDVTESVERESRLTEQRNELAKLDHINQIIRGVDQALLGADSREEILDAVCERLSESNRYRFALAMQLLGDGAFEPQTWAGPADEFVDDLFSDHERTADTCPGVRSVEVEEIQVIQDIADPEDFETADWREIALEAGVRSMVALPIIYEGQTYGIITVYAPFANSFNERELDVLEELRETVGYAIAAVERREREQILTALYETTQGLLGAETETEITDAVVDAASEVLDAPGVGICLFDDDENVLRATSATDELIRFYGGVTEFGPGKEDSATWQAYATGERRFFPDIRESDHVVNPVTDGRSTLLIPLGEHGVFVVSAARRGVFGEKKRRLIGLLAATTEAALDRVAGRADIRERNQELAEQTDRADRLDGLLRLVQGITETLPEASTRTEIETSVCEQLLTKETYAFAWVGHLPPDGETVEPSVWAGAEEGYLDAVPLSLAAEEPATRVASSGDAVAVQDVTDHLQTVDWARHAADRDIQSVAAVPLVHGETTYGVLAVYATEPDVFDDRTLSVLTQVGEATAYAINTIETSQGVLAQRLTELELSVSDPGTFLNAVATVADEKVTYREITPQPGGSARVLFTLADPPVEEILALEDEFVSVESLSVVERGGEHLFRATLSGQTVAATLLDCGGIPTEVVAGSAETTAVVRLSRELDVRVFIDRVSQQFPETELLSRQNVERTATSRSDILTVFDEELTERQREVLLTAYESGFFQSPRETTGEQLAALLDLSQPTVTHHLREAQRRLFASVFDDQ